MVRPPFRCLLDSIFATVSPDGEALRVGSDDAVDRAARRALGELAHCVVSATRFGVSGPGRAVGERFAALTSAVVEDAGGASLSRDERDGLAGLAIVGILCAIDGPSGYLRYIRRFGTVSRFLHHGMLADAEAMVAERDAVAASVPRGSPVGPPPRGRGRDASPRRLPPPRPFPPRTRGTGWGGRLRRGGLASRPAPPRLRPPGPQRLAGGGREALPRTPRGGRPRLRGAPRRPDRHRPPQPFGVRQRQEHRPSDVKGRRVSSPPRYHWLTPRSSRQ